MHLLHVWHVPCRVIYPSELHKGGTAASQAARTPSSTPGSSGARRTIQVPSDILTVTPASGPRKYRRYVRSDLWQTKQISRVAAVEGRVQRVSVCSEKNSSLCSESSTTLVAGYLDGCDGVVMVSDAGRTTKSGSTCRS